MVVKNKSVAFKDVESGIKRKILAADGTMMAVEVHFAKGAVGAIHSHPHEQISYVLSGSFAYGVEGEEYTLNKADSYHVLPNLMHGVVALEDDSILLDVFTPQREDFKQE